MSDEQQQQIEASLTEIIESESIPDDFDFFAPPSDEDDASSGVPEAKSDDAGKDQTEGDPPSEPETSDKPIEKKIEIPDDAAQKFKADLDTKEREVYAQQMALKAEKKAFDTQFAEMKSLKETALQNPGQALRMLGIDPRTLAESLLNPEEPQQSQLQPQVMSQLEAIASRIEGLEKSVSQDRMDTFQRRESRALTSMIDDESDKMPHLKALKESGVDVVNDVLGRAARFSQETGRQPNYKEIMADVEADYNQNTTRILTSLMKNASLKEKVAKLLGNTTTPATDASQGEQQPPQEPPKSLSNASNEEVSSQPKELSDEESLELAARILEGKI